MRQQRKGLFYYLFSQTWNVISQARPDNNQKGLLIRHLSNIIFVRLISKPKFSPVRTNSDGIELEFDIPGQKLF